MEAYVLYLHVRVEGGCEMTSLHFQAEQTSKVIKRKFGEMTRKTRPFRDDKCLEHIQQAKQINIKITQKPDALIGGVNYDE